jgi:hypothetical protein
MDGNLGVPHKGLEEHHKKARSRAKQNHSRLIVSLRHVATPEADARISRAFDILLGAAAKNDMPKSKERPKAQRRRQSGQTSSEEAMTHGKMKTIRKGKNNTDSNCESS